MMAYGFTAFTVFSPPFFASLNPLFFSTQSIFRRLFFLYSNGTLFAFTWSGGLAARRGNDLRAKTAQLCMRISHRNISLV
jgi:hypothetical protein